MTDIWWVDAWKNKDAQRYIISSRTQHPVWYFHSLKNTPILDGVVWTRYKSLAYTFYDEESVEEFKMKFISPRKVFILRTKV